MGIGGAISRRTFSDIPRHFKTEIFNSLGKWFQLGRKKFIDADENNSYFFSIRQYKPAVRLSLSQDAVSSGFRRITEKVVQQLYRVFEPDNPRF